MDEKLKKLFADWMTATSEGNLKNKIGEQIGEICADQEIRKKFGEQIKELLSVPRRGEEGVVILDLAYELEDGGIVLVESKFNTSQKGKLIQRMFAADDEIGAAQHIRVEGGITQLEGQWIKDRIAEIKIKDPALAQKMESAWADRRLHVLGVRTEPKIIEGVASLNRVAIEDATQAANDYLRGLPTERTARQQLARNIEKKIAVDRGSAEAAQRIANDLRTKSDQLAREAEKLRGTAIKARRDAINSSKAETKITKEAAAVEAEKNLAQASAKSKIAEEAATRAEGYAKSLVALGPSTDKVKILEAVKKADHLEEAALKAGSKATAAGKRLEKAIASLAAAKRTDSMRNRGKIVDNLGVELLDAEQEAQLARQNARQAAEELEQLAGSDPRAIRSRAKVATATKGTADDGKVVQAAGSGTKAEQKSAEKAEEIVADKANAEKKVAGKAEQKIGEKEIEKQVEKGASATVGRGVGEKMMDRTATASKGLVSARTAEKEVAVTERIISGVRRGEQIGVKLSKVKSVVNYAFKGVKVVAKVGHFAFTVLELVDPIFYLLDAIALIDALVDWLQRDKLEREAEWRRLVNYMFSETTIITTRFGVPYLTSIRTQVMFYIQQKLSNQSDPQNFFFWFEKWNREEGWDGFVYSEFTFGTEKQQERHADDDEPFKFKYSPPSSLALTFKTNLVNDAFIETPRGIAATGDDSNFTTRGKIVMEADPKWTYDVDRSWLDIRFTQPLPCLTPFDFILVKCRGLYSALVGLAAKFDPLIDKNIDSLIDESFVNTFLDQDLFKDHFFEKPLNDDVMHTSMKFLFNAIKWISEHVMKPGDTAPYKYDEKLNSGMYRRQQLVYVLLTGKEGMVPFRQLAKNLANIFITDPGPDRDSLAEIPGMALDVQRDLERVMKDTRKRPYSFQYRGPEKRQVALAKTK